MSNINQTTYDNAKNFTSSAEKATAELQFVLDKIEGLNLKDGDYLEIANGLMRSMNAFKEHQNTTIYIQQHRRASRPRPSTTNNDVEVANHNMLNCSGCSRPIFCPIPAGGGQRDMSRMVKHRTTNIHINIVKDKSIVKLTGKLNTVEYRQRLRALMEVFQANNNYIAKRIIAKMRDNKATTECIRCDEDDEINMC